MNAFKNILVTIGLVSMLFTVATLNSCKKDSPVIAPKTIIEHDSVHYAWQPVAQFSYTEPNVLRAMVVRKNNNNYAMFFSNDNVQYFDSIANQWNIYGTNYEQQIYNEVQYPSMNKDMVLGVGNNSFFSIYDPIVGINGNTSISQVYYASYDTNFKQIGLPGYTSIRFDNFYAALSDSNRMMVPVQLKNGHYCIYSFDIKINFQAYSFTNFKRIFLPDSINAPNNRVIFSFGNRFIANTNSGTYLIRENGTVKQVSSSGSDWAYSFTSNNTVYATEYYTDNVYASTDNGETWTVQYHLSNPFIKFFPFDGKIIGVFEGQLWQYDFQPGNLVIKEINNYGLSGHLITSILKFNNTVYISTTSGVYSRPYADFYQYK